MLNCHIPYVPKKKLAPPNLFPEKIRSSHKDISGKNFRSRCEPLFFFKEKRRFPPRNKKKTGVHEAEIISSGTLRPLEFNFSYGSMGGVINFLPRDSRS